jgi:hypothetical protein
VAVVFGVALGGAAAVGVALGWTEPYWVPEPIVILVLYILMGKRERIREKARARGHRRDTRGHRRAACMGNLRNRRRAAGGTISESRLAHDVDKVMGTHRCWRRSWWSWLCAPARARGPKDLLLLRQQLPGQSKCGGGVPALPTRTGM